MRWWIANKARSSESKNFFSALRASVWSKKRGGAPLDPPLLAILIVYIRIYDSVWKTSVFVIQFVVETYPASGASFWFVQWGGEIRDGPLFIEWGGGAGGRMIFGGITLYLGVQKGESVVTEKPKEGITENVGRIQRRDHSNLLRKWRHWGRGGSRKSLNVIRGNHFGEVTFKGQIG